MHGQQVRTVLLGFLWSIHFPDGYDAWGTIGDRIKTVPGSTDDQVLKLMLQVESEIDRPLIWRRDPAIELSTQEMVNEYNIKLARRRRYSRIAWADFQRSAGRRANRWELRIS